MFANFIFHQLLSSNKLAAQAWRVEDARDGEMLLRMPELVRRVEDARAGKMLFTASGYADSFDFGKCFVAKIPPFTKNREAGVSDRQTS